MAPVPASVIDAVPSVAVRAFTEVSVIANASAVTAVARALPTLIDLTPCVPTLIA